MKKEIVKDIENLKQEYKKLLNFSIKKYIDFQSKTDARRWTETYLRGEEWFRRQIENNPRGKIWTEKEIKRYMYWCEYVFNNLKNEKFMNEIKKDYVNEALGWANFTDGSPEDRNYVLKSAESIQKLKPLYEKAIDLLEKLRKYLINFSEFASETNFT